MVLAEFIKLKHRLYKSCGVECVDGILLEPSLLQPCFHVDACFVSWPRRDLYFLAKETDEVFVEYSAAINITVTSHYDYYYY